VRWLIRYVSHHDFIPFAWYRIAFGAVILATAYLGWVRWD
jgi:undecaprenyl-diphosphatase